MRPSLRPILLGAAVTATVLFLGAISFGMAFAGAQPQASVTASPTSTPRITPTPTPTPKPTPTATPTPRPTPVTTPRLHVPTPVPTPDRTQVENYTRAVSQDSTHLGQAMSEMGQYCGNQDVAMCRLKMEAVGTESEHFLHDLDMNPAPPCLQAADRELRTALKDYEAGAQQGIQGLDVGDASMIQLGANEIQQGTSHMNQATTLTKQAVC